MNLSFHACRSFVAKSLIAVFGLWLMVTSLKAADRPAVTRLINALSDPDDELHKRAAATLTALGSLDQTVVPTLIDVLKDEQRGRLRHQAADILVNIGPSAVPGLTTLLGDPNHLVRTEAARMLRRIGPAAKIAAPKLETALRGSKRKGTGPLRSGGFCGFSRVARGPVPFLLEPLRDSELAVRVAAADALWAVTKSTAGREILIAALDDESSVAVSAAEALAAMGPQASSAAPRLMTLLTDSRMHLHAENALRGIGVAALPAFREALSSTNAALAFRAANLLSQLGPQAAPAVPNLITALSDSRLAGWSTVREAAASALASIGERARGPLVQALQSDNGLVRIGAATALSRITQQQSVDVVTNELANRQPLVRQEAARQLGLVGPDAVRAETPLIAALSDQDQMVRVRAAEALWLITRQSHVVTVLSEAARAENREIRREAIDVLRQMRNVAVPAVPVLTLALADPDAEVRRLAARALEAIGPQAESAVPALIEALRRDNENLDVIQALGSMGTAALPAVPLLTELMQQRSNSRIECIIRSVLQRIDHWTANSNMPQASR